MAHVGLLAALFEPERESVLGGKVFVGGFAHGYIAQIAGRAGPVGDAVEQSSEAVEVSEPRRPLFEEPGDRLEAQKSDRLAG